MMFQRRCEKPHSRCWRGSCSITMGRCENKPPTNLMIPCLRRPLAYNKNEPSSAYQLR